MQWKRAVCAAWCPSRLTIMIGVALIAMLDCGWPGVAAQEIPAWVPGPFARHEGNPIMEPLGNGFEAFAVYNPAMIVENGTFYMLYRAEDRKGVSRIGLAESEDGIDFVRHPEPVLSPTEDYEIWGGCEDPRVVEIDGVYYMTYTAFDGWWAKLALATSEDLVHWEKHGVIVPWPWSKSGAIIPQEVNGRYVMYFGDTSIWIAYSDDLLNWEVMDEPVLRPRPGYFDSRGIEPGPPPIVTDQGFLLIYNGWDDNITYKVGAVLFSKDDPTQVLARAEQPFLEPTEASELRGQVPNVVFASALVEHEGVWYLYYGAADKSISVAIACWERSE